MVKKLTVEQCPSISTTDFKQERRLTPGSKAGTIRWYTGDTETGSMGLEITIGETKGILRCTYSSPARLTNERRDVDCNIEMVSTPCFFGGRRWWFICPILGCGRRVRILYGPGLYFGCRRCNNLTYKSSQKNHCTNPIEKILRKSRSY